MIMIYFNSSKEWPFFQQRPAKKADKQLNADDDHPGEQIEQGAAGAGHGQDEKLNNDSINILMF